MTRSLARLSAMAIAISALIGGCGGEPSTPTTVSVLSGSDQPGVVGQQLASPIVVKVSDQNGNPMGAVTVSFTVTQGGGSVSPASGSTDESGQVSANWTLGTTAGESQQVRATVPGVSGLTAVFSATATPGEPFVISMVSGDDQFAFTGTILETPIAVRVRDQYANNVTGQVVAFTVPTGRGSVDSAVAFTDLNGEARTGWTVGGVVGTDTAHATVAGVTGSPVIFTATVHDLLVSSVTPTPLVLGGTATLTGSGFSATAGNNTVTVGDLTAVVNSATETLLEISIPDACRPVGGVDVQVTVGGIPSAAVTAQLTPNSFLNLAVGEQEILQDPGEFCLQFDQSAASESFLIGVQSTSEAVSSLTPITFTSVASAGSAASPVYAITHADTRIAQGRSAVDLVRLERLRRHRAAESRIRALDRMNFDRIRSEWSGPQRVSARGVAAVDSNVAVGDTVAIRVITGDGSCNDYDSVTTVVKAKGAKGIWLEDIENPTGGYAESDYETLSDQFDELIYPTDTAEFGGPSDADNNGRIVMVVTKEVNRRGSLGFTTSCDFGARTPSNMGSNEGEFFYGEAPDPDGQFGEPVSIEVARGWLPSVTAHELVHVIQISGRAAVGGSFPSIWIAEGQATLGEEIVGHVFEGREPGQNLGLAVAVNWDDTTSIDWYSDAIVDMALYFGWAPTEGDNNIQLDEAPHECSWLANNNAGPCYEGREAYGVPWSLLRWLSDQYGQNYAGGEAGLQQDIIRSTSSGYALLEQLLGQPIEVLLAQWAATLYVDDRLDGANPVLTMTSWDLYDIFYGSFTLPDGEFGLIESLRLTPKTAQFTNFTRTAAVRAGSTYYTLLSGGNRQGTAIRVGDGSDLQLPSHMQLWVVRMQ